MEPSLSDSLLVMLYRLCLLPFPLVRPREVVVDPSFARGFLSRILACRRLVGPERVSRISRRAERGREYDCGKGGEGGGLEAGANLFFRKNRP